MNNRQRLFVSHYLARPNATQAAIEAGYSKRTAYSQGQRLLKKVEIAAAIERKTADAAMTAEDVLAELSNIARGDYETYGRDKIRSLDLLGRFYRLFAAEREPKADSLDAKVDQAIGLVKWGVSLANCRETKAAHALGTNISLEFALSTLSPQATSDEDLEIMNEMRRRLLSETD